MTAGPSMRCGEVGTLAAAGIHELIRRVLTERPIAEYAVERPLPWSQVREGGWDELGVPAEFDGAGVPLRDLVEVALTWGEFCLPSPLMVTVLAKRWSAAARACDGPVTVAVAPPSVTSGYVAPFGAEPGARVLAGLGAGTDSFLAPMAGDSDEFATTLRLAPAGAGTEFGTEAATELAVLWAAEGVGCARRCLADACAYAKQRTQFQVPIGSFQAVKHRLAHALELTERAETAVLLAASAPRADDYAVPPGRLVWHALVTAQEVIESAIQVHGGIGITWEMGVHLYLRHVIALRDLAGGLPGMPVQRPND